ncbi:MAG: 6-oxocyclohex-1-ene-1-carbonyl-CoA hydratase, partial [Rhodobacteraceae bacterium]|nr:6-oxocyclohex-1-ene-1-carbonyl-CoA hydratase [Paracoccaceae bacterium]
MTETTHDIAQRTAPDPLLNHDLVPFSPEDGVIFEKRPARKLDGSVADGLFNA